MVQSMTGFASAQGAKDAFQWQWDLRSVNSKGLDVRARVPDWIAGLEAEVKAKLSKAVARGSVSISLRISRTASETVLKLNEAQLTATLEAIAKVEAAAEAQGVVLAQASAGDILMQKGVMEAASTEDDTDQIKATVMADLGGVLQEFLAMRASEGASLLVVLTDQIDQMERLVAQASDIAVARRGDLEASFEAALQRIMSGVTVERERVAQELAVLAVKADVTEELDRLRTHIDAARDLLADSTPIGRKLDFLSQEFNREANTLCSKSQHKDLTAVGLELKAVIDQMREQVQNVE